MNSFNEISLDLRFNTTINIYIDSGVSYSPALEGFDQLDSEYTLTFPDAPSFSIKNNKISLVPETNSIIIHIDKDDFPVLKTYEGVMASKSKVDGLYFKAKVNIIVSK